MAETKGNRALIGFLAILIFAIVGLAVSIVILMLGHDDASNSRTATDICRTIESDFADIPEDSLEELIDEFELVNEDEGGPNADFENCYIILRDFYQRASNRGKVEYYEGFLDELLPKDDRDLEEMIWEE